MANRNDSEVHQHETLPGPGPGSSSFAETATGGARPVEQMVDAAIERMGREQRLALDRFDRFDRGVFDAAIEKPAKPTRLRWKGLDVSDEFRTYAERVARGEQLPPFEGRVLAEPNAAFPWGPLDSGMQPGVHTVKAASRAARAALWCSAAVVLGLLTWSVALEFQASRERALLPPLAVPSAAEASAAEASEAEASEAEASEAEAAAKDAVPHDVVETPARGSKSIDERVAEHIAQDAVLQDAVPQDAPSLVAPVSPAAPVPAAPAAVAAAVAPLASDGLEQPRVPAVVTPVIPALPPVPPAPQPQPAPAPAPKVASVAPSAAVPATTPEVDFGIDAVSTSDSAALKSSVTMTGSVGDLARSGQVPGASVRKEPGSESSAKGSLLVENPSF